MYNLDKLFSVAQDMDSFHRDCCITVALKIADDSCKMDAYEKSLFIDLYDTMSPKESDFFQDNVFEVISQARTNPTVIIYSEVKHLRETAMDMITRPKMKAFKASIRKKISY